MTAVASVDDRKRLNSASSQLLAPEQEYLLPYLGKVSAELGQNRAEQDPAARGERTPRISAYSGADRAWSARLA